MTWIGLSDRMSAAFDIAGVHPGSGHYCAADADALLPVGSLLLEAGWSDEPATSQTLLRFRNSVGWQRGLDIVLSPDGRLEVTIRQGAAQAHARLNFPPPTQETTLRITYGWDAPARRATLTIEDLGSELIAQAEASAPLPLPVLDARAITLEAPGTALGDNVRLIAFSDRTEPVGLPLGLLAGTPVETPNGPQRIERLRLGDLVVTSDGRPRPVRWIARRTVPAMGSFRPIRLRRPYFGLTRDILCAPDHHVALSGAEAEYLFAEPAVLVAAERLLDGKSALREKPARATLTYYHILLDQHECLKHAGLWGESLFVGAIGRDGGLMATTALADLPASALPHHRRFALPVLTRTEARSLIHARSA